MKLIICALLLAVSCEAAVTGQITALQLINAKTEKSVMNLVNGAVISVRSLGLTEPLFNINATISGMDIASVRFAHNGTLARTSNAPFLSFCGHAVDNYWACSKLAYGKHTITATPYNARNGAGEAGQAVTVTFTITDTAAPVTAPVKAPVPVPVAVPVALPVAVPVAPVPTPASPLTKLELINAGVFPNTVVATLTLGAVNVINLPALGLSSAAPLNINAVRVNEAVNSVMFSNGRPESSLPWAYCGNVGANFTACPDLVAGARVNITVLPYPMQGLVGTPFPLQWAVVQFVSGPTVPTAPVAAPTKAPVALAAPTKAPIFVPTTTTPQQCKMPKLVGSWVTGTAHPFPVAEAQGAMIGKTNVIVGGFLAGYNSVSTQTHTLDTTNPKAVWQRQDDYPFSTGVTHGAFVVVGNKFYMCGGYAGGGIGMHTDVCMVYDNSQPKGAGLQWARFAPLPSGGRAGGGMVYDTALNVLIFSAGATRPIPQKRTALDHSNTWMYSLSNPGAGWVAKAPMPFHANHMSSVTAIDATGKERHYFSGGQKGEDEHDGNQIEHYEYDSVNNAWIKRKFMSLPRSHAASSTRAIGCGFIMVAGCTNGGKKIADISYYDTATDTWTKIGDLSSNINTPVCGISGGILYCDSGWDTGKFSKKIGITL